MNEAQSHCTTCNGIGMIGGYSGQTPEQYEEWSEACPDCTAIVETNTPYGKVSGTRPTIDYINDLINADLKQALEYRGDL